MSNEIELKVRESMNETSFRRYEGWIGGATKGSIYVNPMTLPKPKKQSSFAVGIREAIRGYKKYHYNSSKIPFGYDMSKIQVLELKDGRVMLRNEFEDRVSQLKAQNDTMTLLVDVDGKIAALNQVIPIAESDRRLMIGLDEVKMVEWCQELMTKPTWRLNFAWLVKTTDPMEIEFLQDIRKNFEGLDVEKLDHGWWRLYR